MAPTAAAIAGLLKQAVYYHLDTLSYQNALFFAERLHAHDQRSPESAYLLALSHFRLGDSRSAYEAARLPGCRGVHLGCSYIFAQACLDLERFKDGISALEKARPLWTAKCSIGRHTASSRAPYPDAAAVSSLLGKLYRAYDDKKRAVACFEDALKANPFMWDAFTSLCDMGVNVMVPNIFKLNEPFARSFDRDPSTPVPDSSGAGSDPLQRRNGVQGTAHDYDPFGAPHRSTAFQDVSSNNMMFVDPSENDSAARMGRYASSRHPSEGMETPTGSVPAEVQTSRLPSEPPLAPVRRTRGQTAEPPLEAPPKMSYRLGARKRDRPQEQQLLEPPEPPIRPTALPPATTTERKRTASGHPVQPRPVNGEEPRRSARLLMNGAPRTTRTIANAPAVGAAPVTRELKKARPPISRIGRPGSSGTTTVGRVVSGNRKPPEETSMDIDQGEMPRTKEPIVAPAPPPPPPKPIEIEPIRSDEGLKWILDLLKKMASGYRLASMFQCQEALSAFASLPRSHQDTPWVLARMARAHYELANYAEAEKFFRRLRMIAPTRHEDMEYYSTVLWQLRKGTELSFLAHELTDSVWDSPQAWCVLGNAFSLDCEHEQALQCFKRAIQLHPKFAYAYTLQGHEHVENEEYDKALAAYRRAIAADKRHYNAYYGIGKVYEKLGNYDKALAHYHAALVIHPTHAVLICCMGTVLQRQKQIVQALPYFVRAVELAPRAPEMRSKKAGALLATGQLEEARRELMILRDAAPNNAQVHFLLAKLAKTLGDRRTAVRHFTIALSLDPKASGEIKNEIASLEDDDMDDSMMH